MLNTPVVLVIFNRPQQTARVFERIRMAQPRRLFIIGDGARSNHPGEVLLVQVTRKIVENVDWPCKITRLYSDTNQGGPNSYFKAGSSVFKEYEAAIFLEDDTLPIVDFFHYCEAMLEHYAQDPRIIYINGMNNFWGHFKPKTSVFFSRYVLPWGAATWRRSWDQFDLYCKDWALPEVKAVIRSNCHNAIAADHWSRIFDEALASPDQIAYDYSWQFLCLKQGGLTLTPACNLVTNIGFGKGATHTQIVNKSHIIATKPLQWPLIYPTVMAPDAAIDDWIFRIHAQYEEARPWKRFINHWRITLGRWFRKLLQQPLC